MSFGFRVPVDPRVPLASGLSLRLPLVLVLALLWPLLAAAQESPVARRETVTLHAGDEPYVFSAEIADTPAERARGLMFRTELADDHGMLFDFAEEAPRSFWMKNTLIPLDIIFAEADGDIVAIAENTTPLSEAPIPSGAPARFVFEVVGGTAERIGLKPGDRLEHRRVERR